MTDINQSHPYITQFKMDGDELMLVLFSLIIQLKGCWPFAVSDILKLEKVQKAFTSKVNGCRDLPYYSIQNF